MAARIVPVPSGLVARVLREVGVVLAGSVLVALAARIRIPLPFTPVPITGQTFGVLLVGAALGAYRGALSLSLYLLEGLLGLPVFAGGASGLKVLAGPTGGYLLGFILAAWVTGRLAERGWDRSPLRTAAAMLLGEVAIYAVGLPWLAATAGAALAAKYHTGVLVAVLAAGLFPFIPGDTLKLLAAAGLLPGVWKLLGEEEAKP